MTISVQPAFLELIEPVRHGRVARTAIYNLI